MQYPPATNTPEKSLHAELITALYTTFGLSVQCNVHFPKVSQVGSACRVRVDKSLQRHLMTTVKILYLCRLGCASLGVQLLISDHKIDKCPETSNRGSAQQDGRKRVASSCEFLRPGSRCTSGRSATL